jgi:hypothetical protein
MIPDYFAYLTILFSIAGSFFYIKDILYGKTRPNIVSWVFWAIAPLIGTYIGYKSGISIPLLLSTFMAGFSPLLVIVASFFNKKSYWKITRFDIWCGVLSFVSIIIWVTTKNGMLSLTFAILADLFASIPTIIKSWEHSETEIAINYSLGILNQLITFLIMKTFSFQSFSFPIYFVLVNLIIVLGIKKKFFNKLLAGNISHNK